MNATLVRNTALVLFRGPNMPQALPWPDGERMPFCSRRSEAGIALVVPPLLTHGAKGTTAIRSPKGLLP